MIKQQNLITFKGYVKKRLILVFFIILFTLFNTSPIWSQVNPYPIEQIKKTIWNFPSDIGEEKLLKMADLNGDGIVDFLIRRYIHIPQSYRGLFHYRAFISHGNGSFTYHPEWDFTIDVAYYKWYHLIDFNGDNLADLYLIEGNKINIFFNTGSGWEQE